MRNIYIRVKTEEQLKVVQNWGKADTLIVDGVLEAKLTGGREAVVFCLPDAAREARLESIEKMYDNCSKSGGLMIKNLDELGLLVEKGYEGRVIGDSFLYAYNSEAAGFYMEYYPEMQFVCSDELTDREMQQTVEALAGKSGAGSDRFIYKVYGYQQLMISNQCVSRNYTSCSDKVIKLKDDKGNSFIAQSICSQCYSILYNGSKTYMMDKLEEIPYRNLMLDFTIEDGRETDAVLRELDAIISEECSKARNAASEEYGRVRNAESEECGKAWDTEAIEPGKNRDVESAKYAFEKNRSGKTRNTDKKTGITRGHHYKGVD